MVNAFDAKSKNIRILLLICEMHNEWHLFGSFAYFIATFRNLLLL